MEKELQAMKDFGVYGAIKIDDSEENHHRDALPAMWVQRPRGAEIRCRLVCTGCYQETTDTGDAYANTPLLINLKLLLRTGLAKNYNLPERTTNDDGVFDVTAFLDSDRAK